MANALHINRCRGRNYIHNFSRTFLGHQILYLIHALEYRFVLEIHHFYTFYPKITLPLDVEGVSLINNFSFPYPTHSTHKIWFRLDKMLTQDEQRTSQNERLTTWDANP